jgi:hypothetical protein
MEELIAYLNDKIEGCDELGMFNESWAFKQCIKKARSIKSLQTAVSDSASIKRKKCDYCEKRKNKDDMYFLLKEKNKQYWICSECNYEHDVV